MKRLSGLYVVIDPNIPEELLLTSVEKALKGGADVLQLWNTWTDYGKAVKLAKKLLKLAKERHVPFLINNDIDFAKEVGADGVHLDHDNITPSQVKRMLGGSAVVGVTCGNDLNKVKWAKENGADYISFCAVFPSSSAQGCEIVPLGIIREAKQLVKMPIFASGGITRENVEEVLKAGVDGVALISAIFGANNPVTAAKSFKLILARHKYSK